MSRLTDPDTISAALDRLSNSDPTLAKTIEVIGTPTVRTRPGGYAGLFRIIVEQQVSVPSARSILARCDARLGAPRPEYISACTEEKLRACGLSGPKIRYVKAAAAALLEGQLNLDHLASLDDQEAAAHLTQVKGIGPWTAGIYLLFCECRSDIWPKGDVALLAAYAAASGFSARPAMRDFDAGAVRFAPYRGIAAHCLWTYYGHMRGRPPVTD